MLAGRLHVGASVSLTVTVKVQEASGETPFEAVQVTVVTPFGKAKPEAGLHVTVGTGQPSAVGGVKVTIAVQAPASLFFVIFAGHVPIVTALLTAFVALLV